MAPSLPKLVGIVNVTPDSFSDGGAHFSPQAALDHALKLVAEGADILDIGAESTRPGATPLTHQEEWARLEPVLLPLLEQLHGNTPVSIDSYHPETLEKALRAGCLMINDVSGGTQPAIAALAVEYEVPLVIMHHLGLPARRDHTLPEGTDPIATLLTWAETTLSALEKHGVKPHQVILDPGIGFGKTTTQNWEIIHRIGELHQTGLPLYVGHSRKTFLAPEQAMDIAARDAATAEVSLRLAKEDVHYLRVHAIALNQQALKGAPTSHGMA